MGPAQVHKYFILYKPYNMVSQFVSPHDVRLLGDLNFDFPAGTHAIGRLDHHSEGLLILTTNKKITKLLFEGPAAHERTYLVQVKNRVSKESLALLQNGVEIKIKSGEKYTTLPGKANIIEDPSKLCHIENVMIAYPPFTWLTLSIKEGKYHQVRKMTKALHHRCYRLIRLSIEDLTLQDLKPGEVKEISEDEFFRKLHLTHLAMEIIKTTP